MQNETPLPDPAPGRLRPDLQRIVDNAKTAPQWDTERDCLAPAPVDALVEAAERAERIIANGQPDEIADAGAILRAALSAIRESRT